VLQRLEGLLAAASEPGTGQQADGKQKKKEQEIQQPAGQVKAGLKQNKRLKQEKSQQAAGQKRAGLAGEAGAAATKRRA
jgi:hypothetical protein